MNVMRRRRAGGGIEPLDHQGTIGNNGPNEGVEEVMEYRGGVIIIIVIIVIIITVVLLRIMAVDAG